MYHRDLLFREDPRAETEVDLEDVSTNGVTQNTEEEPGWDVIVEDLQDDEDFEDYDEGDVFVQEIL